MPQIDQRTISGTRKGKKATSGRLTVKYKDAKGRSFNAIVLNSGGTSGIKLEVPSYPGGSKVIDNVALVSAIGQTQVYSSRT